MKRYLVYSGDVHYPAGGMKDLFGEFETLVGAGDAAMGEVTNFRWAQVVDTKCRVIWHVTKDGTLLRDMSF